MAEVEQLQAYASTILRERIHRTRLFPVDIFDEYAWEIMLGIFAAGNPICDRDVFVEVGCRPTVGDRWVDYLVDLRQATRSGKSGNMIDLTDEARSAISTYLTEALKRAEEVSSN